jgi:glucose dehydrogenase
VSVDNYDLTLVDLKNVGHKDNPWVLADRVAQIFYVVDSKTGKHIVISEKQKIVGVENIEDNDEDVNRFKDMSLFNNPLNIKYIEKTLTIILCHICEKLYENFVSYFILMLLFICIELNLSHIS